MEWDHGRLSTTDSVASEHAFTGTELRDAYVKALPDLTLGLARLRDNSVVVGPFQLLRFGPPRVTESAVEWPIEGGLLAQGRGGSWRIKASRDRVEAQVTGYRPSLPRPLYWASQLNVHLLFTRLYLLRLRGRDPAPGPRASNERRLQAAAVDLAFCLTLAGLTGRRRPARTLAIAIAYHVMCWSLGSRTLGGVVVGQRVVAVDGSRLTPAQSLLRLALMPVAWITGRAVQDELAGSDVIND